MTVRIAALYDIHGNLPALEAVLDEVRAAEVDRIVVGGDVVPGPMPGECLAALDAVSVPVDFIRGNGENDALTAHRGEPLVRVPEPFHEVVRWVTEALGPGAIQAIADWPATIEMEVDGVGRVLFCHATPRDDNELFTRETPAERLHPLFDATGADVVVVGHTHMQFDRRIGKVRVVNAGSVGMPFGDPGAFWLLLGPEIGLRRTTYDLGAAQQRMAESGYPGVAQLDVRSPPSAEAMLQTFEAAARQADAVDRASR